MHRNVRFQGEPVPDYDQPEVDYDVRDEEPAADYDDVDPTDASPVVPQLAGRSKGNLRQVSRSPDTEHDLSVMENLNEVSILRVLEERFMHDVIQVMSDTASV